MPTPNYNLPTVSDADVINGAAQITGLANAVDEALDTVAQSIPAPYVLPAATSGTLGGVKVGEGLSVTADGTLSTEGGGGGGSYVLPAATSATLGGIKVGTGLTITPDGLLSVDLSQLVQEGTTWGDIKDHGFLHD